MSYSDEITILKKTAQKNILTSFYMAGKTYKLLTTHKQNI
jgi:hypothetical protein